MYMFDRAQAEHMLNKIFGISHFYDEQWMVISKVMSGQRVLMIERTGFGKSLCYQFPATQFAGLTVVFSPLIALMRDQVASLVHKGIRAAFVNSEQTPERNKEILQSAIQGHYKILYIAPERQGNYDWMDAVTELKISMIVIDEAHTISTWGHDFRPAFRRIINIVKMLPESTPVLATTATANKRVQEDIMNQIGRNVFCARGSLSRDNFSLYVVKTTTEEYKMKWLAAYLRELPGTGLVYIGTRALAEYYTAWFKYCGIDAVYYHAGLEGEQRIEIEKGLKANKWKCIVSTNALGMGIDKPDIRFVIHTQIPVSPIHYYQEIGRAGRDNNPANIILLYNTSPSAIYAGWACDCELPLSFINNARPSEERYTRVINCLKNDMLGEREIMKYANLKQTEVRTICSDLVDAGTIRIVELNRRKYYEYVANARPFDYDRFEKLRQDRLKELEAMIEYVDTKEPRMDYLCRFLDNNVKSSARCDNTTAPSLNLDIPMGLNERFVSFIDSFSPIIETADVMTKTLSEGVVKIYKDINDGFCVQYGEFAGVYNGRPLTELDDEVQAVLEQMTDSYAEKKSRLTNGFAASYYGTSDVGALIHHSKYERGGDFPEQLLEKVINMFRTKLQSVQFDMIVYVPPTKSGTLVKNFAHKLGARLGIRVSDELTKIKETSEQKVFRNSYGKAENVRGAFDIAEKVVRGKTILLFDDIFDSGATLKEIGRMMTAKGAAKIVPIVIAKTIGGV